MSTTVISIDNQEASFYYEIIMMAQSFDQLGQSEGFSAYKMLSYSEKVQTSSDKIKSSATGKTIVENIYLINSLLEGHSG